jgi:hypothetical protein
MFTGDHLKSFLVQDDHMVVVADQLYQMLQVAGNTGDVPDFVPKFAACSTRVSYIDVVEMMCSASVSCSNRKSRIY